jgi:hypothetical protein
MGWFQIWRGFAPLIKRASGFFFCDRMVFFLFLWGVLSGVEHHGMHTVFGSGRGWANFSAGSGCCGRGGLCVRPGAPNAKVCGLEGASARIRFCRLGSAVTAAAVPGAGCRWEEHASFKVNQKKTTPTRYVPSQNLFFFCFRCKNQLFVELDTLK